MTSDGTIVADEDEDLFRVEIVDEKSTHCQEIATDIRKDQDGRYVASLTPERSGTYSFYITANGVPILDGKKFKLVVVQHVCHKQSEVTLESIDRLRKLNVGSASVVTIVAKDKYGRCVVPLEPGSAPFEVQVTPISITEPQILNLQWTSSEGIVTAAFIGSTQDTYHFNVTLSGETITNGKFVSSVSLTTEPISCEAIGIGIESDCLKINEETNFVIQAKNALGENMTDGGDIAKIEINRLIPGDENVTEDLTESYSADSTDHGDGTYRITYTPTQSGIHAISVIVNGEHIANSPFHVGVRKVCDPSKCTAHGKGVFNDVEYLTCDRPVHFVIQTKDAEGSDIGFGGEQFDISATVSFGDEIKVLEYKIEDNQDGTYHVEYTPSFPGDVEIAVSLHGTAIHGSPFRGGRVKTWCDPLSTVINGDGIHVAHSGRPTTFDIVTLDKFNQRIEEGGAVLTVQVSDPGRDHIRSYLADNGDGSYRCHYTPSAKTGPYTIDVKLDGTHVNGSPFTVNVTSAIFAHKTWADGPGLEGADISSGENIPAVFTIYARDISNSPVLADIDEETVEKLKLLVHRLMTYQDRPKDVRMLSDQRQQQQQSQQQDESEPGDSITVTKIYQSRYYFDEIQYVSEDELIEFNNPLFEEVDNEALERGSHGLPFQLDISNIATNDSLDPLVVYTGNGEWTCLYTPQSAGDHMINILTTDTEEEIKGSPFFVPVSEGINPFHTEILRQGVQKAYEGFMASFLIQPKDKNERLIRTGGESFNVVCTDVDNNPCHGLTMVDDLGNGMYRVYYVPTNTGYFHVRVNYKGVEIKGSPVKCFVRAYDDAPYPPSCQVFGMKKRVLAGCEANFLVSLKDARGRELKAGKDDVDVQILSSSSAIIPATVVDHLTGRYTVKYTAMEKDDLWIDITVGGQPIAGSPFRVKVVSTVAEDRLQITNWTCVVAAPTNSVDLLDVSINAPAGSNVHGQEDASHLTVIRPDVSGSDGLFEIHYELNAHDVETDDMGEPYVVSMRLNGGEHCSFTHHV